MFKTIPFTASDGAKNLTSKGYGFVANPSVTSEEIEEIRIALEAEFKCAGYPQTMNLDEITQATTLAKVSKLIDFGALKNFINSLSKITGDDQISIFPNTIMRNYFPSPHLGNHEWHTDAQGEYGYSVCSKMHKQNYIFGKISIPLQLNNEYGGNIDILPKSFDPNGTEYQPKAKLLKFLRTKLMFWAFKGLHLTSAKRSALIQRLFNIYLIDIPAYMAGARSLNPPVGSTTVFDHRIMHRGSPATPSKHREIFLDPDAKSPYANDLKEKNKYILYLHFGNQIGLNSYIYDRSRRGVTGKRDRSQWIKEKKNWLNETENLKVYQDNFPTSIGMLKTALREFEHS